MANGNAFGTGYSICATSLRERAKGIHVSSVPGGTTSFTAQRHETDSAEHRARDLASGRTQSPASGRICPARVASRPLFASACQIDVYGSKRRAEPSARRLGIHKASTQCLRGASSGTTAHNSTPSVVPWTNSSVTSNDNDCINEITMSIDNVLASVAVKDLKVATVWYDQLFGRP